MIKVDSRVAKVERKIGVLVGHPTQFEVPFYRFVSSDSNNSLRVIYWNTARSRKNVDEELSREVDWGMDLFGGYSSVVMPERKRVSWLYREIKEQKFDLFIVNGYSRPELIAAAVMARRLGCKVALRLDSVMSANRYGAKALAKKILLPILFSSYRAFFAIGSLTRQYLLKHNVPPERIHYFTYAVDHAWFRKRSSLTTGEGIELKNQLGLSGKKKLVLAVAKFSPRETPWDLLRAAVIMERDDVEFLIVGDGEEKEKVRQFTSAHARARIAVPGYVPYVDLPRYYGIADVFVHAAKVEPYGVSVAEALASGLAVIASSTVGAANDLIVQGHNGYVYKSGETDQLVRYLEHILDSTDWTEVRNTSDAVLRKWGYESTWEAVLECLNQD